MYHTHQHNQSFRLPLGMMLLVAVMLLCACSTATKQPHKAPESKAATVSEANSFHDKLQIPFDDKGLDLNVNIAFDEEENILTISLTGTRQLMVFRDDIVYKSAFRKAFLGKRHLKANLLPYPVLVRPNTKITLAKEIWNSFPKKRSKHIFNNWLTNVSRELQVIAPSHSSDESAEATLIVDSIVQRFHVAPKATKASFTLRNILVADRQGKPQPKVAQKRNTGSETTFQIVGDNDLNLTYNLTIQRDPCFGQDSLIEVTNTKVNNVMKAYATLRKACPTGIVTTPEEQGIFNQHRQYLLSQFPFITDTTSCYTLQTAYSQYNQYVDSIATASCHVVPIVSDEAGNSRLNIGVRARTILDAAHRLDNLVSQIMVTHDAAQEHDLTVSGRNIILSITKAVHDNGLHDEEQRKAYEIFLRAKSYFNASVNK